MNNQFFCEQNYGCIYMKYIYREREKVKKRNISTYKRCLSIDS